MAAQRSKRKWKFILGVPVILLIGLVVLIALLPTFISAGLGHGRILAAIQPHINGRVDFAGLTVRWRGPQEMTGLRIRDAEGNEVANLDLRTELSLIGMIFGTLERITIDVSGRLDGTLHEDGTTSFQKLVRTDPARPQPNRGQQTTIDLAGLPELRLNINLHRVSLHDQASGIDLVLNDAVGGFRFEQDRRLSLQFESETETEGLSGRIKLSAVGDQFFDPRGRFTPGQASATIDLEATALPIFGLEQRGELQQLKLSVKSARLTDRFIIELDADAQIEDMEPSRMEGALTLTSLFRDDGTLDFRPENLSGVVSGDRVPSSIVQPFLAATPIVLTRDAGPTLDVNVDFVAGDEMVAAISAFGSRYNAMLEVDATFNLDSGAWTGRRLVIASDAAHPALIKGYTGMELEQPTDVVIELTSFSIPPVDEATGGRALPNYAASGSIVANGPLFIAMEGDAHGRRIIRIEQARVDFDSPRLGDDVTVNGSAVVEDGRLDFDERITNLFDADGAIDAFSARPVGTLTVNELPSRVLIDWFPEHEELLTEALGELVNAELTTRIVEDALEAKLDVRVASATVASTILHRPDRLRITETHANVTISPRLAALAQREQDLPITLLDPLSVAISLEPLTLMMDDPYTPRLPDSSADPVRITASTPLAAFDAYVPLAEAFLLRNVEAQLAIRMGESWSYDMVLAAVLRRHVNNDRVARINADLHIEPGEELMYRGNVALGSIRTSRLEHTLGREPDSLLHLLGDNGDVTANLDGRGIHLTGSLTSTMPRIGGRFDMSLDDDWFTLTSERADVSVKASVAEGIINRQPDQVIAGVEADLPLQLSITKLRVPTMMLLGNPDGAASMGRSSAADIEFGLRLTGGPAKLKHEAARVTLSDINLELESIALRTGIEFSLTGNAAQGADRPGKISVTGAARELFDDDDVFEFARAKLDLDTELTRAPTMLLDALIGMNGYLLAAVGPEVNATLVTRAFSANSGTADLDITTANGFLRGAGNARDGLLHIDADAPVTAQLDLNPLLRDMLLSRLHPLLGDIVSTKQPLRASLARATLPMTGDVSQLNGDVEVNIGEVQFDRRSEMLMMLALARATDSPRIDGSVDPIHARIRSGVVEYDQFNVNIAQLSLPQSGRIDLNTGEVALRTNTILGSLASAFVPRQATDALGGRAGHLIRELDVPILYRGTFGNLKASIDPEFKLEQKIARILAESLLHDVIPGRGDLPFRNPGNLFDDLFRRAPSGDPEP